ncbi:MAG: metal-dependent hydrolase [Nanoarchaeota archaeon]|nr:metal-dependent hydrolase [Nanoarchaeota archaeon]
MVATLTGTLMAMADYPYLASADLMGHVMTGYLLSKEFYPGAGRVETAVRSVVGGFLPDIDFAGDFLLANDVLPQIEHRSFTHSLRYGVVLPAVWALFAKAKMKTFAWLGAGVAGHLILDSCGTLEERAMYIGTMSVALLLQKYTKMVDQSNRIDISKISSANNNI